MKNYLAFVVKQATLKTDAGLRPVGVNGLDRRRDQPLRPGTTRRYMNFTQYSWDHNNVAGDGSGLDDTGLTWAQYIAQPSTTVDDQIHLINPMDFIGTSADTAPNWYVPARHARPRHGVHRLDQPRPRARGRRAGPGRQLPARLEPAARRQLRRAEAMAWIAKVVGAGRRPAGQHGQGSVGGTVPATLSLTLGAPAAFGAFTPGVAKDYDGLHDGQRDLHRRRRDAVA